MSTPNSPRWAPILTVGFGTATALWIGWFLTHMPATAGAFPPGVAGPVLLGVAFLSLVVGARLAPSRDRLVVGAGAGVVAGLAMLLVLGSELAKPGEAGLAPSAGLAAAGFVALMGVLGLFAGGSAWRFRERDGRTGREWLSTFAVVTAFSVLPLIAVGGLVTSGKAGMAVPDWPGTYGANMFLYPISLMARDPRIFLEHSHRLFATFIGVTTIVLTVFTFVTERSKSLRLFACLLLAAVIVQGLIGAFRVVENKAVAGMVHGVLAQLFMGTVAAFAAVVSPAWHRWRTDPDRPAMSFTAKAAAVLLGVLVLQVVFGTMIRHLGSRHALYSHMGFSFVVLIVAALVGAHFLRHKNLPVHGRPLKLAGHGITMAVGIQFLLGWLAFWAWMTSPLRDMASPTSEQLADAAAMRPLDMLVRTAHQANGALLMASTCVGCAWAWAKAEKRVD